MLITIAQMMKTRKEREEQECFGKTLTVKLIIYSVKRIFS